MKRTDIKNNMELILSGKMIINCVPSFRRRIYEEKLIGEIICGECGLEEIWNGKPIKLELDHKDGNRRNNERTNLRYLCPNCHSQTKTYRIKNYNVNNHDRRKHVKEEILLESIKKGGTIASILRRVGMRAHGHNYDRVHKIKNKYKL